MLPDVRAWPSEEFAFEHLGFRDKIKSEVELMHEQKSCIPEAIFRYNDKNVSVEVKRIIGNYLPEEGGGRRVIRRRKHIIWPWTSTVEAAINKLHESIVDSYFVQEHHIVFVIPDNLSKRSYSRLCLHIRSSIERMVEYNLKKGKNVIKQSRIHTHIIEGPVELFDRF